MLLVVEALTASMRLLESRSVEIKYQAPSVDRCTCMKSTNCCSQPPVLVTSSLMLSSPTHQMAPITLQSMQNQPVPRSWPATHSSSSSSSRSTPVVTSLSNQHHLWHLPAAESLGQTVDQLLRLNR